MSDKGLSVDKEMLQKARRQFCLDIGLDWEEYLAQPDKTCYICKTRYEGGTRFPAAVGARHYAGMDSFFKAIICMGQLFLCIDEQIYDWAVEKFADCQPEWFCDYNNLRMIDEKLQEYGRKINDTHIYFLPADEVPEVGVPKEGAHVKAVPLDVVSSETKSGFRLQWFEQEEILQWKENNEFSRAICFSPTQPDVLAVAALKDGGAEKVPEEMVAELTVGGPAAGNEVYISQEHMAGMSGVSEDGEFLWQIGINVRPEYAGQGLAVQLVRLLKEEILRRGKVPFYGTSESHTVSQTVGLKAGFAPAWTEIYVRAVGRVGD